MIRARCETFADDDELEVGQVGQRLGVADSRVLQGLVAGEYADFYVGFGEKKLADGLSDLTYVG